MSEKRERVASCMFSHGGLCGVGDGHRLDFSSASGPPTPCRSTLGPAFVAIGFLVKIRNPAWSVEAKCQYLIPASPASPPAGLRPLLWETEAPCWGPGTITYASRPKAPGPVPVTGGSCVLSRGQGAGTWMGMRRDL